MSAACGRCHPKELLAWRTSSHARGEAEGGGPAATCVSCHGSHAVLPVHDEAAPTSFGRVSMTCARCHDDPAVLRHTELPTASVEGFEGTFHGVALSHGILDVATCPSCHEAHQILPASDPRSSVSPGNLSRTCGACHPGVTPAMVGQVRHQDRRPGGKGFLERLRIYFPVAGATDAAQITAGATSGALSHSRLGNVDFKMGILIVGGGWAGGFAGVQFVRFLRNVGNFDFFLKAVYVLVLGFIGLGMLREGLRAWRGRSRAGEPSAGRLTFLFSRLPLQADFPKSGLRASILLPVGAGVLVGLLAAFLGVGGGFIMLPTMIYIIGIPTRVAVGTDLFQIVLTSANVTLQQSLTNQTVDVMLAVTLFAGSVIGAQFGVAASRRLRGEQIRVFLALIVLVVMAILLVQLLVPPAHLLDFARSGGGH